MGRVKHGPEDVSQDTELDEGRGRDDPWIVDDVELYALVDEELVVQPAGLERHHQALPAFAHAELR